jgi:acylphosphatase
MTMCHIFITGFVQGVGYRRFVRHHALKLNLTGWVKNLADNRVEVFLQGRTQDIEKMIEILKKGSFLSEVKDVVVEWGDGKSEENLLKTFEIKK